MITLQGNCSLAGLFDGSALLNVLALDENEPYLQPRTSEAKKTSWQNGHGFKSGESV